MGLRELEALIQAPARGWRSRRRGPGRTAGRAAARRCSTRRPRSWSASRKLYASESGRRMREALLAQQKLTAVEPEDFRAMEALVRRMAKRLATRYARKRHRAHKGKLDVRKTIRRSMGHGGVPFDIVWKTETLHKPKIAVHLRRLPLGGGGGAVPAAVPLQPERGGRAAGRLRLLRPLGAAWATSWTTRRSTRRSPACWPESACAPPTMAARWTTSATCRLQARSPHHGDHPGRRPLQLRRTRGST